MWNIICDMLNGKISFTDTENKLVEYLQNIIKQESELYMADFNRYKRVLRSQYIKNNKRLSTTLVSEEFIYNIKCLDKHDFSNFITEGRSLINLVETLEHEYDKLFKEIYGIYLFDELDMDDLVDYFSSRYAINFQPYIDWVVRKENDPYEKTRRRIKDCD